MLSADADAAVSVVAAAAIISGAGVKDGASSDSSSSSSDSSSDDQNSDNENDVRERMPSAIEVIEEVVVIESMVPPVDTVELKSSTVEDRSSDHSSAEVDELVVVNVEEAAVVDVVVENVLQQQDQEKDGFERADEHVSDVVEEVEVALAVEEVDKTLVDEDTTLVAGVQDAAVGDKSSSDSSSDSDSDGHQEEVVVVDDTKETAGAPIVEQAIPTLVVLQPDDDSERSSQQAGMYVYSMIFIFRTAGRRHFELIPDNIIEEFSLKARFSE